MLFNSTEYTREITKMYPDELTDYLKRIDIILNFEKINRVLENETVLRYYNGTEQICICTKFLFIKLNYRNVHLLREKISLLSSMLSICYKIDDFKIQQLSLKKNNAIICTSLHRLFQCFEKKCLEIFHID